MSSQKEALLPLHLLDVDVPIVSSYRREQHVDELKTAARYFNDLGFSTYPSHLQNPVKIDDEFVFFSGNLETLGNNKRRIEIEFLKSIYRAKLVYVVATNGYLGRSASIELAYAMLINVPIALSQPITEFGEEVPYKLKSVIENNMALFPIVPIHKIRELREDSIFSSFPTKEKPPLRIVSEKDKKAIYSSIRSLVRDLDQ